MRWGRGVGRAAAVRQVVAGPVVVVGGLVLVGLRRMSGVDIRGETSGARGAGGPMRGGLRLGPPGRWWDDKGFAKTLGLSKDQQKRMDTVFNANKGPILENYKALQKEESNLEKLTREKRPDEAKIFAGIDAVAQARAALEKSNAHMLLLVRQEMDDDQNARLERFQEPMEE